MDINNTVYGLWHKGIKPSNWTPDFACCSDDEIKRWARDLEREDQGSEEFEGYYGIGIYE